MAVINLNVTSTIARLEAWVSDPLNIYKPMEDLKKKLAQGEMEGLENYLKNKKLKTSLCLNADDVDKIRSNEELGWFLDVMNDATFPTSLLDLFFEKNSDSDPKNHLQTSDDKTSKDNKHLKRKEVVEQLLQDWAKKQCDGSEKELQKVLNDVLIKHVMENSTYPFLVAENIIIYNKPLTEEQKKMALSSKIPTDKQSILFITDEKRISATTMNLIHYQMFVTNIRTTLLLRSEEPKEQQMKYNPALVPSALCLRCISELFIPALIIFIQTQRKDILHLNLKI